MYSTVWSLLPTWSVPACCNPYHGIAPNARMHNELGYEFCNPALGLGAWRMDSYHQTRCRRTVSVRRTLWANAINARVRMRDTVLSHMPGKVSQTALFLIIIIIIIKICSAHISTLLGAQGAETEKTWIQTIYNDSRDMCRDTCTMQLQIYIIFEKLWHKMSFKAT